MHANESKVTQKRALRPLRERTSRRRGRTTWLLGVASAASLLAAPATAGGPPGPIVEFDVPAAGASAGQGTNPYAIGFDTTTVGYYEDDNNLAHSFLRRPDGQIETFDPPGAVISVGWSVNLEGAITGIAGDAQGARHGYVRSPHGKFTLFDAPGGGTGPGQGTRALNINLWGAIAGQVQDSQDVHHGFLRSRDGRFTTFDAPGAGTTAGTGTFTNAISGLNLDGAISGYILNAAGEIHGYLRDPDGHLTTYDPPGFPQSEPASINAFGVVTGIAFDANGMEHGYVRSANGKEFVMFDVPGAGINTEPNNINDFGEVVGDYIDATGTYHAFIRSREGAITTFDVAGAGTGPGQGTLAISNNLGNAVAGWFIDTDNVQHGFLLLPRACAEE